MNRGILFLLFGLVLAVLPTLDADTSYEKGYVNNDGYTYGGDGYWYYAGKAYTRQKEYYYTPSYSYGYGYSYPSYYQTYRWRYYEYYPPSYTSTSTTTSYTLPSPTDPGWRGKLLEIAKQRDAFVGNLKQSALEQHSYMESLRALGLEGNFWWNNYGQTVNYPNAQYGYQQYNLGSYGANAATVYAHSENTMAQIYGSTDMSILYQQAAKLTENAQELAGQGHSQFLALVEKEGYNRERVAEILAKGHAAAQALHAAEGASVRVQQSRTVYSDSGHGGGVGTVAPPSVLPRQEVPYPQKLPKDRDSALNLLRNSVMAQYCYSCHNAKDRAAKLDLTGGYASFDEDLKDHIWEKMTHPNAEKRMPPPDANGRQVELPKDELRLFERQLQRPM